MPLPAGAAPGVYELTAYVAHPTSGLIVRRATLAVGRAGDASKL